MVPPQYLAEEMYHQGPGPGSDDPYRLPPIDQNILPPIGGYEMGWQGDSGLDYWPGPGGPSQQVYGDVNEFDHQGYGATDPSEFRLPPLLEGSREGASLEMSVQGGYPEDDEVGIDPRMRDWGKEGLQTPSGHVMFNERLFDGALGSAGLSGLGQDDARRDEGLAGFDEAMRDVHDVPTW